MILSPITEWDDTKVHSTSEGPQIIPKRVWWHFVPGADRACLGACDYTAEETDCSHTLYNIISHVEHFGAKTRYSAMSFSCASAAVDLWAGRAMAEVHTSD